MHLLKRILLVLFFIFILIASLAAKENSSNYIPENSVFVFSMNLNKLYEKSDVENNVFLTDLKKRLLNKTNEKESKIYSDLLENPDLAGVERRSLFHIFYVPKFVTKNNKDLVGITGDLNNSDAYKNILIQNDFIKGKRELYTYKNFNYIVWNGFFSAWDDNKFIIIYDLAFSAADKNAIKDYEAILNGIQKNNLSENNSFKTLMSEEWDFCAWFNFGSYIKNDIKNSYNYTNLSKKSFLLSQEYNNQAKKYAKMNEQKSQNEKNDSNIEDGFEEFLDVSDFIEMGEYGTAAKIYKNMSEKETEKANKYIQLDKKHSKQNKIASEKLTDLCMTVRGNFLDGKVVIDEDIYAGKNLSFPKASENKMNSDMIRYFPSDYIFFMGASIDINEYYNFFKEISFGNMIESLDKFEDTILKSEFTMKEVLNMFSGNFYFSFSEYNPKNKDFKLAFSAEIQDKNGIDKLINKLKKDKEISIDIIKPDLESYYFTDNDKEKVYILIKDNLFYLATSDVRNSIISDKSSLTVNDRIKIKEKNNMVGFLDYKNLLGAIYADDKFSAKTTDFLFYLDNKIKNVEVNTSTINNKRINYKLIIELSNAEENSLKVLLDWILFYINDAKII